MFLIRRLILSAAMFVLFCVWLVAAGVVLGETQPQPAPQLSDFVSEEAAGKISAAVPEAASAKPAKPRKVLVLTESAEALATAQKVSGHKFVPHESAPHCAEAVVELGRKTGAFEATVVTGAEGFTPENLNAYDAVVLANVYLDKKFYAVPATVVDKKTGRTRPHYLQEEEKPIFAARQRALEDFLRSGRGLIGIHNATAAGLGWPEYNTMIGGTHFGHAWWAHQTVPVKLDDPSHPLCAAFGGKGFEVQDDIYYFTTPYSRENLHVLLSVDTARAPKSMTDDRADGDYPISWIKSYGQGRVFYTSLGHQAETFQNAAFMRHLLDGIQYALGDLKADASSGKPLPARGDFVKMPGFEPLFDGQVRESLRLIGPNGWAPKGDIIRWVTGPDSGTHCSTKETYGDFVMRVDFRLPCMSDSGVIIKRGIQVNIWGWKQGSGQLWGVRLPEVDGQPQSTDPTSRQDRATGEWNTMLLTVKQNRLTTVLNGIEVMNVLLPQSNRAYEQSVALQNHTEPLEFQNIYIKGMPADPAKK
jgi:type 1 glutamine amidotransferase